MRLSLTVNSLGVQFATSVIFPYVFAGSVNNSSTTESVVLSSPALAFSLFVASVQVTVHPPNVYPVRVGSEIVIGCALISAT